MAVIGTDFGTSNSATVIYGGKDPHGEPVFLQIGNRLFDTPKNFPSYVTYDENAKPVLFGVDAQAIAKVYPKRTIYDIKRLIGRRFDEPEFQCYRQFLTYDVESDKEGQIVIRIGNHLLKPEDVASDLMVHMLKKALAKYEDIIIDRWIVSVPAYYDLIKREKIKCAAMMAAGKLRKDSSFGIRVRLPDYSNVEPANVNEIQLITEPTAALHTYLALKKCIPLPEKYFLLFDIGAGCLDISIGEFSHEINPFDNISMNSLNVISIHGNNDLGGRRMDEELIKFIEKEVKNKLFEEGRVVDFNETFKIKLKDAVETAKIQLSQTEKSNIYLEEENITYDLTRIKLEQHLLDIIELVRSEIRVALQKAGDLNKSQIGAVIMVGGPSKMPCIRRMVEEETIKIDEIPGWDPLLCIAEGATRYAEHPVVRKEPTTFNYYIGGVMMDGVVVPWQIAKTGDVLPHQDSVDLMVRKGVHQNHYHILTEINGQYRAFNTIRFSAPSGGHEEMKFSINYPWGRIQYFNEQMPHNITYRFGIIKIEYTINEEGLIKKPRVTDPIGGIQIQYTDLPQMDYGFVTVTDIETFDRNRALYANEEYMKIEKILDEEINETMRIHGLSRREAELKIIGTPAAAAYRDIPYPTLQDGARAAIMLAKESGVGVGDISSWQREIILASVESAVNRQRLWSVIWAVHMGMSRKMSEGEYIAEINRRIGSR